MGLGRGVRAGGVAGEAEVAGQDGAEADLVRLGRGPAAADAGSGGERTNPVDERPDWAFRATPIALWCCMQLLP
jgi:hypothetical protein